MHMTRMQLTLAEQIYGWVMGQYYVYDSQLYLCIKSKLTGTSSVQLYADHIYVLYGPKYYHKPS